MTATKSLLATAALGAGLALSAGAANATCPRGGCGQPEQPQQPAGTTIIANPTANATGIAEQRQSQGQVQGQELNNQNVLRGGDQNVGVRTGDQIVRGGDQTVRGGDQTVRGGDQTVRGGDQTVRGGDQSQRTRVEQGGIVNAPVTNQTYREAARAPNMPGYVLNQCSYVVSLGGSSTNNVGSLSFAWPSGNCNAGINAINAYIASKNSGDQMAAGAALGYLGEIDARFATSLRVSVENYFGGCGPLIQGTSSVFAAVPGLRCPAPAPLAVTFVAVAPPEPARAAPAQAPRAAAPAQAPRVVRTPRPRCAC